MTFSKVNLGNLQYSFIVSLIYVGTGTLGLLGMTIPALNENVLLSRLIVFANMAIIQVSAVGFGLVYDLGSESWPMVLIVQLGVFPCGLVCCLLLPPGSPQKIFRE